MDQASAKAFTVVLRPVDRSDPATLAALLEVYRQCEDFLALGPQPQASLQMVQADLDLSQSGGGIFCGIYLSIYPKNRRGPLFYIQKPQVFEYKKVISRFLGSVLRPSEEMVGVADYIPYGFEGNRQHAFIELLMIAQPFRSHGLGERIVAELEAEMTKDPLITAIRLGCQVNNPGGIRFWQRCGYRIIGPAVLFSDQTTAYPLEKRVE